MIELSLVPSSCASYHLANAATGRAGHQPSPLHEWTQRSDGQGLAKALTANSQARFKPWRGCSFLWCMVYPY